MTEATEAQGPTPLELEILGLWKTVLNVRNLGIHDYFIARGGTPESGSRLVSLLEERYGGYWHLPMLIAAPTVAAQAAYLERFYLSRTLPPDDSLADPAAWRLPDNQIDEPVVARKNPTAVFILFPGRSGSTLLRVMLAGHPDLFSPPELDLLSYATIRERNQGCLSGWSDPGGLNLAIRELWQVDQKGAAAIIAGWDRRDLSCREVYGLLQDKAGGRLLVEKCVAYPQALATLRRAEAWFEQPRYVHLIRHPLATIRSFRGFHLDHAYEIGDVPPSWHHRPEMMWLTVHENIVKFLNEVPPERHCRLTFEDLVTDPQGQMQRLMAFLGLPFTPTLLTPYEGNRMTENNPGRTAGDRQFYAHRDINPALAQQSRRLDGDGRLHPETIALAESLGYTDL